MIPLIDQESSGGWLFSSDGGVFTLGDAPFYGSFVLNTNEKVVAVGSTNFNRSYYCMTSVGRLLSCGQIRESRPFLTKGEKLVVATIDDSRIAYVLDNGTIKISTLTGEILHSFECREHSDVIQILFSKTKEGLYLLYSNGTIETFGDAKHCGDFRDENISAPPRSMALVSWDEGYWIVDSIGGVFCFGSADYFGSVPGDGQKIDATAIVGHFSGRGYWIIDRSGMHLPFGYADIYQHDRTQKFNDIIAFIPYTTNVVHQHRGARSIIAMAKHLANNTEDIEV